MRQIGGERAVLMRAQRIRRHIRAIERRFHGFQQFFGGGGSTEFHIENRPGEGRLKKRRLIIAIVERRQVSIRRIRIDRDGLPDLLEVSQTPGLSGPRPGLVQGRQQHRRQYRYDCYYDKQFYQCKQTAFV